jgi:hypothetical protein
MSIKIITKADISKLKFDFSDYKEVKFFKKVNEAEFNIIERIKDLNCLKELFIDYKKKKENK